MYQVVPNSSGQIEQNREYSLHYRGKIFAWVGNVYGKL